MTKKKAFFAFLIADIAVFIGFSLSKWILRINHLVLRNVVNYSVYAILVIITLVVLIIAISFLFRRARQKEEKLAIKILSWAGIAAIILFIAFSSLSIFIRGVFGHEPEHVVEREGRTMLARVDSFLQVEVRYFDYVNAFVHGSRIRIREDYGNGGYDPFEWEEMPKVKRYTYYDENGEVIESNWSDGYGLNQPSNSGTSVPDDGDQAEIIKLDIEVVGNRENELVFNISIEDFIESYNGNYWEDYQTPYLPSPAEWGRSTQAHTAHSVHETYQYWFKEDPQIWSMPELTVYVPTNSSYIQEITLDFDDHGYTEPLYLLYQEMSFYALKTMLSDFSDKQISQIYTGLMNKSGDPTCFVPDGEEPTPKVLYSTGGIGLYPYYSTGVAHICIIPVIEQSLELFAAQGVEIYSIDSLMLNM